MVTHSDHADAVRRNIYIARDITQTSMFCIRFVRGAERNSQEKTRHARPLPLPPVATATAVRHVGSPYRRGFFNAKPLTATRTRHAYMPAIGATVLLHERGSPAIPEISRKIYDAPESMPPIGSSNCKIR